MCFLVQSKSGHQILLHGGNKIHNLGSCRGVFLMNRMKFKTGPKDVSRKLWIVNLERDFRKAGRGSGYFPPHRSTGW